MNKGIFNLYRQLTDIKAKFCCLCYSHVNAEASCVRDFVVFNPHCDDDAKETSFEEEIGIQYILQQILGNKTAAHLSDYDPICNKCLQSAINSYKFIKMCRENTENMACIVDVFTSTLENAESEETQDHRTMFTIMDFEESKCTLYYDNAQFTNSNAALYKFQTLFRPYRKITDNKGNTKYRCTKCIGVFRSQSNAMKHFNLKHDENQEKIFKDEIKDSPSDDDYDMCTDDIDDDPSEVNWTKRNTVKSLNELSHEVILDCDGVNKYKCKVCGFIYSTASRARHHYKIKHLTKKDIIAIHKRAKSEKTTTKLLKPGFLTEFTYCKDSIKHLNELSHTVIKDSCGVTKYKCRECNTILSQPRSARKHYFKFHVVETKIEENSDSKDNNNTEENSKIINEDKYPCVHCNEKYDSKFVLIEHLLNEHSVLNSKTFDETTEEEKMKDNNEDNDIYKNIYTKLKDDFGSEKFCCRLCLTLCKNYQSIKRHFYNRHVKPEVEAEQYICSQCGKEMRTRKRLTIHEQRHTESKVVCETCNKEFKNIYYFKDHACYVDKMAKLSGDSSEFKCIECGKCFKNKRYLQYHKKFHVPKKILCPYCPKLFRNSTQLRDHQVTHTKEKNFSCGICGDVFVAKNALVYHTRIHTGEQPYECNFCDKRFLSASRRADHVKRHHIAAMATCSVCGITIKEVGMHKHMKRHLASNKEELSTDCFVSMKRKKKASD